MELYFIKFVKISPSNICAIRYLPLSFLPLTLTVKTCVTWSKQIKHQCCKLDTDVKISSQRENIPK